VTSAAHPYSALVLQTVPVGHKSLADYTHICPGELLEESRELARDLKGLRVLHLSATAFGGGVSEILYTLVPLMRDLGINCEWQVIYGREEFFNVTKLIHNALQGAATPIEDGHWETWLAYNEMNARELAGGWDVCIVHDPQPAAIYRLAPEKARTWVWRCHIDLSTPQPEALARLLPWIENYPYALFHLREFIPSGMAGKVYAVPPAIDPLAPKNMALHREEAAYICEQLGVDANRPLLCQVSRFDPWKDPLGVIDAYRLVKEELPAVQLALVGSMASDDPEGWEFFNATIAHAQGDPDIHILNNFNNVGPIEVNAFQTRAEVVIQKSTREGFGLTVTEAMWKGRPVVAGAVGGIPLQIEDGETGFLVDSVERCAERSLELLRNEELGRRLGRAAKERVRANFLTPRYLRDYMRLFAEIGKSEEVGAPA